MDSSNQSPVQGEAPRSGINADNESISTFLEATVKRLDIQRSTFDSLDTRAANTLSVGSAILPITFGLLGLSSIDVPRFATGCLLLAGAAYVVLLIQSWLIVRSSSNLATGAPLTVLRSHLESREYTADGLRLWIAEQYEDSTVRNERTLILKTTFVGRASYALYVESALLSVAAIVSLLFG